MVMDHSTHCPGLYCGRVKDAAGAWGACGACPRGFRVAANSICLPCQDMPTSYDWLYLGFMALMLLVIEWYIIDRTLKRRTLAKDVMSLHICALVENVSAAAATLLLSEPRGTLNLHACRVKRLSDWYTLLHNPTPNYEKVLRCTQEAVYPLYSIVLIHYAFSLVAMLLLRPLVVHQVGGKKSIYLTMYLIPMLVLLQATCGGLIYYAFPYLTVIISFVSIAAHLAFRLDQSMSALLIGSIKDPRNLLIVLGHWALHAYGIIAITRPPALLALVPLPTLFYILTSKFTDPSKLHAD